MSSSYDPDVTPIVSALESIGGTLDDIYDVLNAILAVLEKQPTCADPPAEEPRR